jgi:hypothetical protein
VASWEMFCFPKLQINRNMPLLYILDYYVGTMWNVWRFSLIQELSWNKLKYTFFYQPGTVFATILNTCWSVNICRYCINILIFFLKSMLTYGCEEN